MKAVHIVRAHVGEFELRDCCWMPKTPGRARESRAGFILTMEACSVLVQRL